MKFDDIQASLLSSQDNPWEALADLYIKQSTLMQTEASQVATYKKQAADCLTQALKVIKTHLSNNKHHTRRIQDKMSKK